MREFGEFPDYSIRSGHGCIGCIDIALRNKFISEKTHDVLYKDVDELIAMLIVLQRTLTTK